MPGNARRKRGFALMETMVAMLIFSIVATGLAQTIVSAQEARRTSAYWMRATQLAEEAMERVRAGEQNAGPEEIDRFTRSWRAQAFPGVPGLTQVEVTVSWTDRRPRQFVLSSLMRADR